ncbi:acetaldehyde dehydrogenase (acetylating) [Sporichthya sp.]|uniref:acetaldehyde dehydrogenase (acetylating) n=1 Tax=Sporichthya sp. TaxID=65475 RepID=UPI00184E556F|nr:acetaldehyde dehydrogenase (acetylating) [Sporichthya sp.]MBA3742954.1 acetaldehyde dehydrogenase (acetylating) [Sporichthya sp.]
MTTLRCAVVGSGNIGTDLIAKLLRTPGLEPAALIGIDPASEGLRWAAERGVTVTDAGVDWLRAHRPEVDLVMEATSAIAHRANAVLYGELGLQCIDLTPAKLGPGCVPPVNMDIALDSADINLISCGGQATIPMVAAVRAVTAVPYAEIVATIASKSAGPGTRASIDEFTVTTAGGVRDIGGAGRSKAVIVLNPADPPVLMRNTVFCAVAADADRAAITGSIEDMQKQVAEYVPGYRLTAAPSFAKETLRFPDWKSATPLRRLAISIEVEGAGDTLPTYAGNLDIITCAAVRLAQEIASHRQGALA